MGTKVTASGVSIQFCKDDGTPEGAPFYSRYVRLRGQLQSKVIAMSGRAANAEEEKHPGSEDWLTLIAVADSPEKLDEILSETTVEASTAHTSGSSRRVCVELSIGGIRQSFKDRVTIASGPIVQFDPPIVHVVHVKVLAADTKMDDGHPLLDEFEGAAHVFT